MARFPISSWKNNKEILRMFYVTETDSNIHLLKAIKSVWNPIETPPHFSEAHTYKKKLIESNWRNGLAWLVEERFKIFTKNDHR